MILRQLPLALAAALLAACGGGSSGSGSTPADPVVVQTAPVEMSVQPGGLLKFSASVTGAADKAVTWSVDEAGGGTIDANGFYRAPATEGTYHVRAIHSPHASAATAGAQPVLVDAAVAPKKGGGSSVIHVTKGGAAQSVTVGVSPSTATVQAGGSITFSATVTGTANTAVAWAVQEGPGCGSVTASGAYTAPAAAASCHVIATSIADGSTSAAAAVSVASTQAVSVVIAPASPAVDACQTLTFTATVTGASNTAVTWSVVEGAAGGSISAGGAYTAPATAGTYHVMATSVADPTRSAALAVPVSTRVLSVTASPATVTVPAGGTAQFTSTVTTTCGAFTSVRTIDANGAVTTAN